MRLKLAVGLVALLLAGYATAQEQILLSKYKEPGVAESFKAGSRCLPYPEYSDRAAWKKLAGGSEASIIKAGEAFLGYNWQHVPAKAFMDVNKTGSHASKRYETRNREALIRLATAEAVEGKGRFLKDLADGFWFYASAGHWTLVSNTGKDILPAKGKEAVDLGSGRTAQTMAIIWYIFGEEFNRIDPMVGEVFKSSMKQLILDPYLDEAKDPVHWWLGKPHKRRLNNHTPWNTCSALVSFLVVETDQARLNAAIEKSLTAVDVYLNDFPADGLCDEGPTYWFNSVGRLAALLQLLKDASGGKFDVMPNKFISSLGTYISRCCAGQTPKGSEIVANYGDAEPFTNFDANVMWKAGEILNSRELKDLALMSLYNGSKFKAPKLEKSEGFRAFENIRMSKDLLGAMKDLNISNIISRLRANVPSSTYFPNGGQLFIKTADDWFFSAKAANNNEAHNHNDAGSCILYAGGIPVFIDPGVGTYTNKTFGPHRYELWTMVSPWHNLPMINGVPEHHGAQYVTENPLYTEEKNVHLFSVDIQKAYLEEADCKLWNRTYKVTDKASGSLLEIIDSFELNSRKAPDVEHFIIQGEVQRTSKGRVIFANKGKTFEITFPADKLAFSSDIQEDLDSSLKEVWGEKITRLKFTSKANAPLKGSYSIKLKEIK